MRVKVVLVQLILQQFMELRLELVEEEEPVVVPAMEVEPEEIQMLAGAHHITPQVLEVVLLILVEEEEEVRLTLVLVLLMLLAVMAVQELLFCILMYKNQIINKIYFYNLKARFLIYCN
jgi:hypothetical protein